MKRIVLIILSFLIFDISFAQTSAKIVGRLDLSNFKKRNNNSYDNDIPEGEITNTTSYALLNLEILPESYDFNNEPLVYKDGGRQTKVINGGEEIILKFKVSNNGTGIANDLTFRLNGESKQNGRKVQNLFLTKFVDAPEFLEPGLSSYFSASVKADKNLKPSLTTFTLTVDDRSKSGEKIITRPFETDEVRNPTIILRASVIETATDLEFTKNVDSRVEVRDFVKLKVTIENIGDGPATNLFLDFYDKNRYRMRFMEGPQYYNLDLLNPRESKELTFVYRINQTDDFDNIVKVNGIEFFAYLTEDLTGQKVISDNFDVYSPELEIGEAIASELIIRDEEYIERYDNDIPEGEITNTTSYALLNLEILPESYDFNNEPLVYKDGGRQTKVINGGEEIILKFKVSNNGTGIANDLTFRLNGESKQNGRKVQNLFLTKFVDAPEFLEPGLSSYFSASVKADKNLKPSLTTFTLTVDDRSKSGEKIITRPFETDEVRNPTIILRASVIETATDLEFTKNVDSRVEVRDFVKLKVTIENIGDGPATNLFLDFYDKNRYRMRFMEGPQYYNLDLLNPRESKELTFVYRINQTDDFDNIAKGNGIEFQVELRGDLIGQKVISDNFDVYSPELEIGEAITGEIIASELIIRDEEYIERYDKIYKSQQSRNNYALLIANSEYSRITDIPSAKRDLILMEKYFNTAFGIPFDNFLRLENLTGGEFKDAIVLDLKNKLSGVNNANLFVFYAGHGLLDPTTGDGLFLPVEVNPISPRISSNSVKQSDFYNELYELDEVNEIFVFVDACFSGEPRDREKNYLSKEIEEKSLSSRGSSRSSNYTLKDIYKEKINLFSAASKNQTSLSYSYFQKKEGLNINNGLFTTFLASALLVNDKGYMNSDENKDGELSVGELSNYLTKKVSAFSNNDQIPTWSGKNMQKNIIK